MNAKQFRLALALIAAAFLGYHMGSSNNDQVPTANSETASKGVADTALDKAPRPEVALQEPQQPPFEFTRQFAMDRDVTHYSPWAQGGGYKFRPTERARQKPQRYQPGVRNDRRFNAEGLSAPVPPRSQRDYPVDQRFRPLDRRREPSSDPGGYRPMSSPYASRYVHRL